MIMEYSQLDSPSYISDEPALGRVLCSMVLTPLNKPSCVNMCISPPVQVTREYLFPMRLVLCLPTLYFESLAGSSPGYQYVGRRLYVFPWREV
jgi:hypothetical protein